MTALLVMGIALCAAGATFLGGLLALSLRERVPMVLGFSAGAVIGVGLSLLVSLNQTWLALLLGGFAGFFLYIGASDLLPESQRSNPDARTALATVAGAGLLYIVTTLAL